ncbi:MAG TPA: MBL fold metallo-hydrolase, partial [Candidatus Absconditabacterales bacterium]|nr:MBL fold metallo-hydrolase [Candidatus Absconditabacterales bacterium]
MSENNLFGNLNIDFSKKNKQKRGRQNQKTNGGLDKDLTSEAFLRHLGKSELDDIQDPYKLVKKGEKPVKIGSLMGLEQVGQCMFVEYENDLIIIDAAMEFTTHANFGADYIIPDISYIKKNIKKLRGIIITHGHLDHVGSLRDILPELGYPMIYTTPLSLGIIKKTFENP